MKKIGYAELRKEQAEKRKRGELMGIGISSFTEVVGASQEKLILLSLLFPSLILVNRRFSSFQLIGGVIDKEKRRPSTRA